MHTTSYSHFRKNLKSFIKKTRDDVVPIVVKSNIGDVVILPREMYESMDETNYLLSSPANAKRLLDSVERIKKGEGLEFKSLEELDDALED